LNAPKYIGKKTLNRIEKNMIQIKLISKY